MQCISTTFGEWLQAGKAACTRSLLLQATVQVALCLKRTSAIGVQPRGLKSWVAIRSITALHAGPFINRPDVRVCRKDRPAGASAVAWVILQRKQPCILRCCCTPCQATWHKPWCLSSRSSSRPAGYCWLYWGHISTSCSNRCRREQASIGSTKRRQRGGYPLAAQGPHTQLIDH
jgi:hypothetical protein